MKGVEEMRKIKKLMAAGIAVLSALILTISPVNAENDSSYSFDYDDFNDMPAEDIENCVKDLIELESQDGWVGENLMGDSDMFNIESYDMENCYVANILEYEVLTGYNQGKSLSETARNDQWAVVVPYITIKDEQAVLDLVLEENGGVRFSGGSIGEEENSSDYFSPQTLESIVNSEIDEKVVDAEYYYSSLYSMTLVQLSTEENVYIIPHFINRFDNYGRLESDTVYTEAEFFEIMNETFDESLLQPSDEIIGSGMPNRTDANETALTDETKDEEGYGKVIAVTVAAVLLLAVSAAGLVLYNKRAGQSKK